MNGEQKATVQGVLYYDNNANGAFDYPTDVLITNTKVVLLVPSHNLVRGAASVLATAVTGSTGGFRFTFTEQLPGTNLYIAKDTERNIPVLQFTTSASGGDIIQVPVLRPTADWSSQPAEVSGSTISVSGIGPDGFSLILYANGQNVGTAAISSKQRGPVRYTVVSSNLAPGNYSVATTIQDDKGAETTPQPVGNVTVGAGPPPPSPDAQTSTTTTKTLTSTTHSATTTNSATTTSPQVNLFQITPQNDLDKWGLNTAFSFLVLDSDQGDMYAMKMMTG